MDESEYLEPDDNAENVLYLTELPDAGAGADTRDHDRDSPRGVLRFLASKGFYDSGSINRIFHGIEETVAEAAAMEDTRFAASLVAMAVGYVCQYSNPELLDDLRLLELLRDLGNGRALWHLRAFAFWPGLGLMARKAQLLSDELAARELRPDPLDMNGDFSHALASMVDDGGSRTVSLFWHMPDGGVDAVNALLNDEFGVEEMLYFAADGDKMERSMLKEMAHEAFAVITLPQARELLLDALAANARADRPPPGELAALLPVFGAAPARPRRRKPNLIAFGLDGLTATPDFAARSAGLADHPAFVGLTPLPDEAFDYFRRTGAEHPGLSGASLDQFIREVLLDRREQLLGRMAANLEVLAWAGKPHTPANRGAARLWLALETIEDSFVTSPFIREMAQRTAEMVWEKLEAEMARHGDNAGDGARRSPHPPLLDPDTLPLWPGFPSNREDDTETKPGAR